MMRPDVFAAPRARPAQRPKPARWTPAALAATAIWALAGCAALAPPFEAPPLPVAAQYNAAPSTGPSLAAARGWHEHFEDPALRQLISQALANNRDLRISTLRVAEARAAYAIERADGSPQVVAQGGAQRSRIPAGLSPSGQAVSASQFQLAAALPSWEIDFWGAVASRNQAALQRYLATDAAQRAATLALISQVADSYIGLRETDARIALAEQALSSRQSSVRIYTRRVQVGASSRLQLTQVQTLLTQAQALLAQLHQVRETQAHALDLLVGAGSMVTPAAQGLARMPAMAELAPGLPSELLLNRPDIVAAEHQLRASQADMGAARAAFFPRVALTASLGLVSTELDQLFQGSARTWSFAPSISLPIFDAGARDAALEVAQTRRRVALASYEQAVQRAFRDVRDALSARRWLGEQLEVAQAALATQTERARLSQLRFDSGASSFLEVLDAQRDLLSAQQQSVQAQRALLASRVALYAALGGGSLALPPAP